MIRSMRLNRHAAAAIHLAISATVVVTLLTVMLLRWYPGVWFEAMGGRKLLFILAGVDDITLDARPWQ